MPISGTQQAGFYAGVASPPTLGAGVPAPGTESNREDLLDAVINLDKNKTAAFFLAAPKTTANGMNHDWLVDTIPATATGGTLEGADWSSASLSGRVRLTNAVQTLTFPFSVSLDQMEYSRRGQTPGNSNEYENQVDRHLMALEQSVDARAVALGTAVAAASASATNATARLGALRAWHTSSTSTTGVVVTSTAGSYSGATICDVRGAWSRSLFLAVHEAMYGLGANPDTLCVDPGIKLDITTDILGEVASAVATSTADINPPVVRQPYPNNSWSEFSADIQFLRTPFGRVAVLIDRFVPTAATASNAVAGGAAFLYERSRVRYAFWRPMRHYPLPPTGESARGYVHCGVTLEMLQPQTVGILYNLTT